jgi:hypothetical protein
MTNWTPIIYLLAGGFGILTFLKLVCDEIVVKNRVLRMRVEIMEEAAAKARAQNEAEQQEMADDEPADSEVASPTQRGVRTPA